MKSELLEDLAEKSPNRRNFVRKLGIASAAVGVASALKPTQLEAQSGIYDAAILNFALNLEFLEAEFYTYATTGQGIASFGVDVTGSGAGGATTGGSKVSFTDANVLAIAEELAADERTHVSLLQNAILSLGSDAPIAKPAINLNALGFGFGNETEFLTLARIFEDIGVTAYGGAAPLISSKTILGYAARILAVEALHAGNIRFLISQGGITTNPLDAADVPPPPSGNQYFSTDSNALTFTRTPGEVLYLAYGAASVSSGGFFPSGVNGNSALTASSAAAAVNDGVIFTATPNPATLDGNGHGTVTLAWTAPPSVMFVEVHVGSPTGPLFAQTGPTGSAATGNWVTDGEIFFLQDRTGGKDLNARNTLATVIVNGVTP